MWACCREAWRAQFTFTWCQYSRTGSASRLDGDYYYCDDDNGSDNSNLSGRSFHEGLPKISAKYRFNQNILRVTQKTVLLQTCHTVFKFLRRSP
jgi:hypothetical protein